MDPTYDKEQIKTKPEWYIAWILSEMRNDTAPIGWGKYRPDARAILNEYDVTRKGATHD